MRRTESRAAAPDAPSGDRGCPLFLLVSGRASSVRGRPAACVAPGDIPRSRSPARDRIHDGSRRRSGIPGNSCDDPLPVSLSGRELDTDFDPAHHAGTTPCGCSIEGPELELRALSSFGDAVRHLGPLLERSPVPDPPTSTPPRRYKVAGGRIAGPRGPSPRFATAPTVRGRPGARPKMTPVSFSGSVNESRHLEKR